jgi:hypothetical protein
MSLAGAAHQSLSGSRIEPSAEIPKGLCVDRRAMTNKAIAGRPPGSAAIARIVIVAGFRTSLAVGIVGIVCASGTAATERV